MSVTSSGQTHKDSKLNQLGVTKAPPESWYYPALKLAESRRFRDLGWKNRAEPPLSAVSVLTNELANRALAFFFCCCCCHWRNVALQNYINSPSHADCHSSLKLLSVSLRQPDSVVARLGPLLSCGVFIVESCAVDY